MESGSTEPFWRFSACSENEVDSRTEPRVPQGVTLKNREEKLGMPGFPSAPHDVNLYTGLNVPVFTG